MSRIFTLENFYKSDEWRTLLAIIKDDRLDSDGQIICEHCHRPITKSYDCIGHHTIPLNSMNVNDVDISLNPERIMLVHIKCHNHIHKKLYRPERKIYVVYGPPLSGKSSFVKDNAEQGDLIIDIDSIWQCVSGCDRYIKPYNLRRNVFTVRNTLIDMVQRRAGDWTNAWIIGGYPLISERERLVKSLGASEVYIDTSKEECIQRLHDNPDGRNIDEWSSYIEEWFAAYAPPGRT